MSFIDIDLLDVQIHISSVSVCIFLVCGTHRSLCPFQSVIYDIARCQGENHVTLKYLQFETDWEMKVWFSVPLALKDLHQVPFPVIKDSI